MHTFDSATGLIVLMQRKEGYHLWNLLCRLNKKDVDVFRKLEKHVSATKSKSNMQNVHRLHSHECRIAKESIHRFG